jgi:hypothetical protein
VVAIRRTAPATVSSRLARERRITAFLEEVACFLARSAIEAGVHALPSLPERREGSSLADEAPSPSVVAIAAGRAESAVVALIADERRASA